MKRMKPARLEPALIVFLILLTVSLNMAAFFYRDLTSPPGRQFAGTQFYSDDYAIYVSHIKQGQQGRWQIIDRFTSELQEPSLLHEEYLLWGKLTGFLGISAVWSYHLARLLGAIGLLLAFYFFLLKILPKRNEAGLRLTIFVLGTISAGFVQRVNGLPRLYLVWLTDLDITQRFAPLPHYLLGFIGTLLVFANFYHLVNARDKKGLEKSFLALVFASLVGIFALPSSLIVIFNTLALFGLFNLIWLIFKKEKGILEVLKRSLAAGLALALVNLPTVLYYQKILRTSVWRVILEMERFNRGVFNLKEYLLALGPIAFLAPLGLFIFKKKKSLVFFLLAWALSVFGWSFWLADVVGLNPTRFLQALAWAPLAILSGLGLNWAAKNLFKENYLLFLAIITALVVLAGLPAIQVSLRSQFNMYADHSGLIYPQNNFLEAYHFLETKTDPDEVILSLYQSGNLIPFLAGNTVYLGHLQGTLNYQEKVKAAKRFYSGLLSEPEARAFLTRARISLVFWSFQEKSVGGEIDNYSFLEPIYQTPEITIFRFKG